MRVVSVLVLLVVLGLCAGAAYAAPVPSGQKDTLEPNWTVELSGSRIIVPEAEPNNSWQTAQPAACGDVIDPAQINPAGDYDYYSFYVTSGTPITVGTDQSDAQPTIDTYISLCDQNGAVLVSDDDSGPGLYSLISNYSALYEGYYYLMVRHYSTTGTGYYKAFITCTPPASGACCTGVGICALMTQTACVTALGTYMGDDTACTPNPCPQPPVNDTCAGALPLARCSSGSIAGTMASAGNDYNPGLPGPSCTGYAEAGPDVTYVLDLQTGDILHVVYTTPTYDGAIYLVTDCANPGTTCVVGEDDPEPETFTYTVVNAGIYYLIADAYTSATSGTFTLDWSVTCPPPMGSCCYSDGTCAVTGEAACGALWTLGGVCDPNTCEQPVLGACCDLVTGDCTITTQAACGFDWLGGGIPCDATTCAPPTPAERTSWGQIKNTYR